MSDPQTLLEKARIQGVALEITELRDLLNLIDRTGAWRQIAAQPPSAMRQSWPAVSSLSGDVADFRELLRFFHNKITPDGALDDRASVELARLRREIEKQKRVIQESLRAQMRRLAESGAAQEELISIRGERFVIPVKTEHKRRVAGVGILICIHAILQPRRYCFSCFEGDLPGDESTASGQR